MTTWQYMYKSFFHALGVFAYTSAIAWFLYNAKSIVGGDSTFLAPVLMLLLLIISATITGLLVLGRPVMLYMSGLKKEALLFLSWTLGWIALFILKLIFVLRFFFS